LIPPHQLRVNHSPFCGLTNAALQNDEENFGDNWIRIWQGIICQGSKLLQTEL
jgi:hypothetical protein